MKVITLSKGMENNPLEILRAVASQAQQNGADIAEVRKRIRILDALDKAKDSDVVTLEDADYDLLKGLYDRFRFAIAHRDLATICDDIWGAASS